MKFPLTTALVAVMGTTALAKDSRTFAVLRFNGKELVKARMDPIISPGKVSNHTHNILGGSGFGYNPTADDLTSSKCTTAKVKGDNSNYWFPSLYFKDPATGKYESVNVFYVNVYYFFDATNDEIKAFPPGLKVVSGDPKTRKAPAAGAVVNLDPSKGPINPVTMTCPRTDMNKSAYPAGSDGSKAGIADPTNKGQGAGFPDVHCDGQYSPLRIDVHFPSCYNPQAGLNNQKENMVFPSDAGNGKLDCPKGHVHVPHMFLETYWETDAFKDRWVQGQGNQPFVFSNGDVTGFSAHGDFMSGWDQKVLQHIIDTCDVGHKGMEQCPGVTANTEDCSIPPPTDEKVSGILDVLPGNNPLAGWSHGLGSDSSGNDDDDDDDDDDDVEDEDDDNDDAPPAAASVSSDPMPTSAPAPASACTQNCVLQTIWETVTVTVDEPTPGATVSSESSSEDDVAGFKHAGCFKDSDKRVLTGVSRPNLGAVTNENCVNHCKSAGFVLAGTEYGGECYCGNELQSLVELDESECNTPCAGDESQMCGGGWALTVYSKDGEASAARAAKVRRHAHQHLLRHRSLHQ